MLQPQIKGQEYFHHNFSNQFSAMRESTFITTLQKTMYAISFYCNFLPASVGSDQFEV